MPHIYINEIDNTTVSREMSENVVYIPILASAIADTNPTEYFPALKDEPQEYSSVSALVADLARKSEASVTEPTDSGYIMAKQLLSLGLPVLVDVVSSLENPTTMLSRLVDKGKYSVKFITFGGHDTTSVVHEVMLNVAAARGDCVALLDHKKDITAGTGTYAEAVRADLGLQETGGSSLYSNKNLKFGAAFSPWCAFKIEKTDYTLPPSFAFLSAYASSVSSNPNWYAAAGKSRGQIPNVTGVLHEYGDAESNELQARKINDDGSFNDTDDNQGIAINPIAYIRSFGGYVVWGNRTLINNKTAGGLTASSFLNIRNLCCDIKKTLYAAAREFTFEQNGDILWVNFSARIRPLLDRALSGNGIKGYKLIKEESNKRGRLKARVKIVPIEAVEDFFLELELVDSIETVSETL